MILQLVHSTQKVRQDTDPSAGSCPMQSGSPDRWLCDSESTLSHDNPRVRVECDSVIVCVRACVCARVCVATACQGTSAASAHRHCAASCR
jgi:hypothetical protein